MTDSILDSVKKALGFDSEFTAYDVDILMHINSVFTILNQIGVGPKEGYMVEDKEATWQTYTGGDNNLNSVKTFMFTKVRLIFDPPSTSYAITAMEKVAAELEWRLNVHVDKPEPDRR